jgi:hypothetical protein
LFRTALGLYSAPFEVVLMLRRSNSIEFNIGPVIVTIVRAEEVSF